MQIKGRVEENVWSKGELNMLASIKDVGMHYSRTRLSLFGDRIQLL